MFHIALKSDNLINLNFNQLPVWRDGSRKLNVEHFCSQGELVTNIFYYCHQSEIFSFLPYEKDL